MPIRFTCQNESCGRSMKAPDSAAGRPARCPACGTVQTVPGGPESPKARDGRIDLASLAEGDTVEPAGSRAARGQREQPLRSCPRCGTVFPVGQSCPECAGKPTDDSEGRGEIRDEDRTGRLIKMGVCIVLLAVVAGVGFYGVYTYRTYKQEEAARDEDVSNNPMDYYGRVMQGLKQGEATASAVQLDNIWLAMQDYARDHGGKLPPSLETLAEEDYIGGDAFTAPGAVPGSRDNDYEYISGQTTSMEGDNLLLYESREGPDGKYVALTLDGATRKLHPHELRDLAEATRERLKASQNASQGS